MVWRVPAYWPGGVRHGGGASLVRALGGNVGTCRPAPAGGQWSGCRLRSFWKGGPQAAESRGALMRGTEQYV